jgi:galactose mutarotase-like enzyme
MTCRIDDRWTYEGLRVVRLESRHLAIDVLPELGGNIYRLVDKVRDHDVLWKSPRVRPHRAALHANFDDHWAGGWDEVFPGGVPSHNRYGDELPYMGELWTQEASYAVVEAGPRRVELELEITTPITPARWTRRLVLEDAAPVLHLDYRLENLGTLPFDYNWGLHPVQAISPQTRFDAPAGQAEVDENGGGTLGVQGDRYRWPRLGDLDVRHALEPDAGCFALHYLTELEAGWVAATDTRAQRGFGLVFDTAVFPVVWLWLVYGGWRGYYHAIMEPWTGYPSALADAVTAGRARELAAGEVFETSVAAVVYGGVGSVGGLAADGAVEAAPA